MCGFLHVCLENWNGFGYTTTFQLLLNYADSEGRISLAVNGARSMPKGLAELLRLYTFFC